MNSWREWMRLSGPKLARYATALLATFFTLMFVAIAIWHLRYPYEIEWYEGLMMDHVMRVVHGLPIYARPSVYFTATLYEPLYFYLVAPLVALTQPSFLAGRIVTITCTLLTAVVISTVVRRLTRSSRFSMLAALGLFFLRRTLLPITSKRLFAPMPRMPLLSFFPFLFYRRGPGFQRPPVPPCLLPLIL